MKNISKKCPKTMSGKHKWEGGYLEPEKTVRMGFAAPIMLKEWEGKTETIPAHWIEKECIFCGIIDDSKLE